MATYDNRYSRFVAWLKVLLPVMALVLLSTMFLISRSIDPTKALSYAEIDVEELANSQRITGPRFSGVTSDGAAISFSASTAQPQLGNPANYRATDLRAQIATPDGGIVDISADSAQVKGEANQLDMNGGVVIATSTGYTIHAEGLSAALDTAWIESVGPVTADGPIGTLSAGKVFLNRQEGEAGTYLLVFKDGVKMVYLPQVKEEQ